MSHLSWIVTAYLLATTVVVPLYGKLGDLFGRRIILQTAVIIFLVGSALCGLAQNLPMLVAARVCQGLGGALMVPVGRLILVRSVKKSELIAATALMGVPVQVGPILGPLIGGFITTYASWRWIFWVNLPIGIIGILLTALFIEDVREKVRRRFDPLGILNPGKIFPPK